MSNNTYRRATLLLILHGFLSGLSACRGRDGAYVKVLPVQAVEPIRPCESVGGSVPVNVEIVPGLQLVQVSGLPQGTSDSPQFTICLHWVRTGDLAHDPRIEVRIRAESRGIRTHVGFARLCIEQPDPVLWKKNECFPLTCVVSLPLAESPWIWELTAFVRAGDWTERQVVLGRVFLSTRKTSDHS